MDNTLNKINEYYAIVNDETDCISVDANTKFGSFDYEEALNILKDKDNTYYIVVMNNGIQLDKIPYDTAMEELCKINEE